MFTAPKFINKSFPALHIFLCFHKVKFVNSLYKQRYVDQTSRLHSLFCALPFIWDSCFTPKMKSDFYRDLIAVKSFCCCFSTWSFTSFISFDTVSSYRGVNSCFLFFLFAFCLVAVVSNSAVCLVNFGFYTNFDYILASNSISFKIYIQFCFIVLFNILRWISTNTVFYILREKCPNTDQKQHRIWTLFT